MARRAAFVGAAALVAYLAASALHVSSDATPHILTAASWLRQGNADLREYLGHAATSGREVGGQFVSWYPPGVALLIAPFLAPLLAAGANESTEVFLAVFGKVAGASFAALSVAFTYLLLRHAARERVALLVTAAYAFGTATWAVSSQNLWQHAPSQALVALGWWLLARGSPRAGLALGVATLVRPTDALIAAAGALAIALGGRGWPAVARYVAWGVPALAFLLTYDERVFGAPFAQSYPPEPWGIDPSAYLGLLLSPRRGLLVYSPWLVVAAIGFAVAWRAGGSALARSASLACLAVWLVHGSVAFWWGGWTFGNRYLADVLPLLALGAALALERGTLRARWARRAFGAALGWSVLLQFAGATSYYDLWDGGHWDVTPNIDLTPERLWSWADPQWLFFLRRLALDPLPWTPLALAGAAVATVLLLFAARPAGRVEA